jgi:hypothetical protein
MTSSTTSKVAGCIRIASEYRGVADLRSYSEQQQEDKQQRLTWRAAFPTHWAPTLSGKVTQILFVPLLLPFLLLFVFVFAPAVDLLRRAKRGKRALRRGSSLMKASVESLARGSRHANLCDLWSAHGLPERSCSVDFASRRECLERWVDLLYGNGMAIVMRVKQRVEEKRISQARARAELFAQGGHISFVDPVDAVVRELAESLPEFQSSVEERA